LVGTRSPYGIPRNAVDPLLVPGGSSAGSAVAVARGLVDFALGTDTAGSGRVPAAQNRIIGIKPTRGRLSTRGVVPAVRSLDCVSVFGQNVAIATLGYDVCAGYDRLDGSSRRPGRVPMVMPRLVVGIPRTVDLATSLDAAAWDASVEHLATLEHVDVVRVDIDDFVEAGNMLYGGPWVAERYVAVGAFLETEPLDANPTVSGIIRGASKRTAIEAYEAQYRLDELRRAADDTWARVDVLMVPTTPGVATLAEVEADPIGRNSDLGTYTNWVNLLDQCAVAVPGADRADGWPFGVTFLGAAWSDDTVIELAQRFSTDPPAADQHPYSSSGGIDIVVVGAHLHEQPLNWQLTDHGGRLIRACRTAPGYQLYALGGGGIPKPALVRRNEPGDGHGSSTIEVEVWRLPAAEFGVFSQYVPAPLGLGRVDLDDGTSPTGFIAEPAALDGATDITRHGGWRSYLRDRS
jgi:allophanate hydrolase